MVRVFIKGGVWKNSEDEILKAAIMKYGKQQWARVASLLNRKSAKQCKARWNEWLDPSVKKVEWSREEEEKLLHLAKLMPAQWRTIGTLLNGRSATQCQEHYERLLDDAVLQQSSNSASNNASNSTSNMTESTAAGLRRHTLRPGDIDSHPETKPARPDPIDMDEDEIEMLQEARARLANTQGKKAKRKQREKILNEAKRLADLQKRRELKQAGLMSGKMRRKSRGSKREIDLGVEIPFHKPAPAGFHNVERENNKSEQIRQQRLKKVNFQQINEANYRSRDREAARMQKKEEQRLRSLERANAALAVQKVSQKNDPIAQRKRGILNMPAPTIHDDELQKVAKLAKLHSNHQMLPPPNRLPTHPNQHQSNVTEALLGDYSDRPLPTPMRTPLLDRQPNSTPASRVQSSVREATQMRLMERGQNPLLSSNIDDHQDDHQNDSHHDDDLQNSSETPRMPPSNLPNATPTPTTTTTTTSMQQQRSTINQTPSANSIMTMTPRDQLGLNKSNFDDTASLTSSAFFSTANTTTIARKRSLQDIAREERKAAKRARAELEAALKALPAPQFEYELAVPQLAPEDSDVKDAPTHTKVKDRADLEREELQKRQLEAEKAYEAQSTVLKRKDLPRPPSTNIPMDMINDYMNIHSSQDNDDYSNAAKLISKEMMILVQHDAYANPPETQGILSMDTDKKKKKKKKKPKKPTLTVDNTMDLIPESDLEAAKHLLQQETQSLLQAHRDQLRLELVNKRPNNHSPLNDATIMKELTTQNIQSSLQNADSSFMIFTTIEDDTPKWIMKKTTFSATSKPFSKQDRISTLNLQFQTLKQSIQMLQTKSDKIRAKLNIKHGGYIQRTSELSNGILQNFAELQHSKIEEYIYSDLLEKEEQEIWHRSVQLQKDIDQLEILEKDMKDDYESLLQERDHLCTLKHHVTA